MSKFFSSYVVLIALSIAAAGGCRAEPVAAPPVANEHEGHDHEQGAHEHAGEPAKSSPGY